MLPGRASMETATHVPWSLQVTNLGCRRAGKLPVKETGPVKGGALEHFAAGFAALAAGSHTAHMVQGTERLLGHTGDLAIAEAVPRLDLCTREPCTEGGVGGLLTEPVWVFSPQAAELVSKNWEAYEAHMRDVRDYLEARLEVSRPGSCLSLPYWGQPAEYGAWSQSGYVPPGPATSSSGQNCL